MSLAAALERLRANDDVGGLTHLLSAWQASPNPRVADLIDRVSARITRPPIKGASVKARTAAWLEIAAKKDPADVARLLATPWPGTWKNAMPTLEALIAFPRDPRIAMALTEIVVAAPYDTWTSSQFYRPLLGFVRAAVDARTLPLLRADLEREKSTYWRQGTRPIVEGTIVKLEEALARESPAHDESVLAAMEAGFTSEVAQDRNEARTEEDFLAAIYADPDDDVPRAIFADWLSEHGDPRGEFITLQLGESTEATRKREASLLKKHAKAWLAPLETGLGKHGRVFERGFLARAMLDTEGRPNTPPKVFEHPAWATVWSAVVSWNIDYHAIGTALLLLPSMRFLKEISGVRIDTLLALAREAPRPRVESLELELGLAELKDEHREALKEIADTTAFPGLKRLAVAAKPATAMPLLAGKLARQLERFTIVHYDFPLAELARLVEGPLAGILEIAVVGPHHHHSVEWLLIARRDDAGRFTRIEATDGSTHRELPGASKLEEILAAFGPEDLTELVVDRALVSDYPEGRIVALEHQLARFTKLTKVEVPWERVRDKAATTGPAYPLSLALTEPIKDVGAIFQAVAPLGMTFDSYALNDGPHTSFEKVAQIEALLAKKRTLSVRLYRKGESDTCSLVFAKSSLAVRTSVTSLDAFLAWLADWLRDRTDIESGRIPFAFPPLVEGGQNYWRRRAPLDETPQLLRLFGPTFEAKLPFDELAKIDLPFLRKIRAGKHFILVLGKHLSDVPTEEEFVACERALCGVMWEGYRARWKTTPRDIARTILGPALSGFDLVEDGRATMMWSARSTWTFKIEWIDPLGSLRFAVHMLDGAHTEFVSGPNGYHPAGSPEETTASFETLAARLQRELLPWYESTKP